MIRTVRDEIDGVPVRDVPPDWIGRSYPRVDEAEKPIVEWWARHPDGRLTPVYQAESKPSLAEQYRRGVLMYPTFPNLWD